MSNPKGNRLEILIVEDEEDILNLYTDYFSSLGHHVLCTSLTGNNVTSAFGEKIPDICILDHRLPQKEKGFDIAFEIWSKYPSMPILFITGHEPLAREVQLNPFFNDKKTSVLIKPVRLEEIEKTMMKLVNG